MLEGLKVIYENGFYISATQRAESILVVDLLKMADSAKILNG